ncbi:hypothetical protein CMV_028496 [Castanea mollissima]|uniref:Uncharacterized protein n=1 Tax=Castanea mollissima TaxID=60419 RepID=A0A8J4VEA8_9ROSI|nr:hypothetical protein CMV_028496 [Castanea mollissima]
MDLLLQFQHILQSDPLIDEVGFVHPTQFATLTEDSTGDAAISDGTTFWKLVVSKKQQLSMYMGELLLSGLVLSCSPKSDQAWSHRNWAGLHVADNCCFHYRRRLILWILKDSKLENASPGYSVEVSEVWKEELNWNEMLIKRYIGRQALWLHRRFLSLCWMKQFATNLHEVSCHSELKISTSNSFNNFIDNELHLLNSCSTAPDNDFEDFQAQATYSATYILWLTKQIPEFWSEFQEKFTIGNLKTMMSKVCPERSLLWDSLID